MKDIFQKETLKLILTGGGIVGFFILATMSFFLYYKTVSNHIDHSTQALIKNATAIEGNTKVLEGLQQLLIRDTKITKPQ